MPISSSFDQKLLQARKQGEQSAVNVYANN